MREKQNGTPNQVRCAVRASRIAHCSVVHRERPPPDHAAAAAGADAARMAAVDRPATAHAIVDLAVVVAAHATAANDDAEDPAGDGADPSARRAASAPALSGDRERTAAA